MEPLRVIVKPYRGITETPPDLSTPGVDSWVFIQLQLCFKKQGYVAEGLLPNVIWGFEQIGCDPRAVAAGLTVLRKKGYIYYSDELGGIIEEHNFNPIIPIWIRYTPKFIRLLIREDRK